MAAPMSVNMQSVAQAAGVSIMTVSRVIHQNPKVAKATREKVLAQLNQQGYRRTPFLAAWNSFVLTEHARVPTPGMAVFMSRMSQLESGMPVFYLSTGAWNVAPTLRRFLSRNLYPVGTM
jgi:hypothetical protein